MLWEWCLSQHIFPVARHLAGVDNNLADSLTCSHVQMHEWKLAPEIYKKPCSHWTRLDVDLFATASNTNFLRYFSEGDISLNSLGDAFMLRWKKYLVPVLADSSASQDDSQASLGEKLIVVVPWWPWQPWLPALIQMSSVYPLLLGFPPLLFQNNSSVYHPDLATLTLTAGRLPNTE